MLGGWLKRLSQLVIVFCIIWLAAGHLVFAFRHPWATDTQRLRYSWEALTFQRVEEVPNDRTP